MSADRSGTDILFILMDPSTVFSKLSDLHDSRIGFPSEFDHLPKLKHGWFRLGNQEMIGRLLQPKQFLENNSDNQSFFRTYPKVNIILELGSWLGASTEYILKMCPNAVVIAVDLWRNDYFLSDNHYDKNDHHFSSILSKNSIYDQFLSNLEEYQYFEPPSESKESSDSSTHPLPSTRLIPMQMDSYEALEILARVGIIPDFIYIDASHHYDAVVKDITASVRNFPQAIIVGDDWDNSDVKRAVRDCAKELDKEIYIRKNTCWTYNKQLMDEIDSREKEKEQKEVEHQQKLKVIRKSSFAEALKLLKK